MQPTYYNQTFNTLEAGLTPKSRESILEAYFLKYLPSFTSLFPQSVYGFIQGELTYEQLLTMFDSSIPRQQIRQRNRALSFINQDSSIYGNRSMTTIPEKYERIPLKEERTRFMEIFGYNIERPVNRVPGTINRYKTKINGLQGAGAW